jgi:N4-gp56 family major capsid protein
MPRNQSDTYVARRFMPYGATATDANTQNRFIQNATGDRGNVIVQQHQTQEGITNVPETIAAQDVSVVMIQYSCLYGFTDKTFYLYEDDVPGEMQKQVGERVTLVNELIIYGALRACTNVFYGGTGTSISTVNGPITLNILRKSVIGLSANHAKMVNSMLDASPKFNTSPISRGYFVVGHTDLEPVVRDLPNFIPVEKYANGNPVEGELGACEKYRFVLSPDLPPLQDAGAAIGGDGQYSTTGTSNDVYPILVFAEDAWSQVAVRGLDALDPTYLAPGEKSKSDPHGQRGYAGTMWWKAILLENHGWMALLYATRPAL